MKQKLYSGRWLLMAIIIFIFGVGSSSAQHHPGGFKPEEIICKMQPGYSIDIINNAYGTSTKSQQPQTNCYLLVTPQGQDPESLAAVINVRPDVIYCRVNYYLSAPEPFQRSQPSLDVEGVGDVTEQAAVITLNIATAHAITTGVGIGVAVIDGGINIGHPLFDSLAAEIVLGRDYIDGDSLPYDEPGGACSGHGTFVAGLVLLVAPQATLHVYRVLDTSGLGDGYSIADAVLQAVADSCKVINLSLGMIGVHDALDDAVRYARMNDIMVIASAGNDSTDSNLLFPFPASRTYCLAVAALDSLNRKADFSNYGDKVDLCAPGTGIYAPYLDTSYAWWDGTSFSTAFVSGFATLIYAVNPALSWDAVDSIMLLSAINVDSVNPGLEGQLGYGLIDIVAALQYMTAPLAGDLNGDMRINILDITYLLEYLYKAGSPPSIPEMADVNGDQLANIKDITYLINYLYKGGPPPVGI